MYMTDTLFDIKIDLEKARLMIEDITEENTFKQRPYVSDEYADYDTFKWVFNYEQIFTRLNIVQDYLHKVNRIMDGIENKG